MTRFARCLLLASSSFVLTNLPALAQNQSPAPVEPNAVATLHTGTKLVVVDVVVRDKGGHAVHGLTRDDFLLFEASRPQTVRSFEEYSTPAAPPSIPQMPTLPPGLFTDLTPVPARGPLNVLLIDGLNTPLADQAYLRQELLDYTAHLAPGTRIAIFGLADHLYMLQGFTTDPAVLHAALANVKSGRNSPLAVNSSTDQAALTDALTDPSGGPAMGQSISTSAGGSALMTSSVQTFMEQVGVAQKTFNIGLTIEGFTALGRWLLNFPGRKNVIWFSGAFPLGVDPNASIQNNTEIPGEDSDVFRAMTNLLTRAQVSVYPVDPRGLQADTAFTASGTNLNQGSQYRQQSSSFYANQAAEHATMQAFASDTGGEPFYNTNNLSQAVADAIENGANYYTLSYTPSEQKTGGEWRSIRVELADPERFKGVQISYRRGYFADNLKVPAQKTGTAELSQDPNAPSVESRRYGQIAMLHGGPTPQDIPFTTRILPAMTTEEQFLARGNQLPPVNVMKPPYRRYDVDCAAAARYFTLNQRADGHYVGAVQAAIVAYDARGRLLNTASRTLRFDLTPEEYSRFQKLGFREHLQISVPAHGESFLRVGIEELSSGRIGVVEIATSSVNALAPPDYESGNSASTSPATVPTH